ARVGQLLLNGGARCGQQIVPTAFIDMITRDGDAEAWAAGNLATYYPGVAMHYRAQWYVQRGVPPLLFALGIHGQNLFVDAANAMVIAKFSSQPPALDAALIGLTGRLVSALRSALTKD